MNRKNKNKQQKKLSILLIASFSFLIIGCSTSQKALYPIERTTITETQNRYEHITKPIKYEKPPIYQQKLEFEKYANQTFTDIDNYKHSFSKKRRYGKNRLTSQTNKHQKQHQNKQENELEYYLQ